MEEKKKDSDLRPFRLVKQFYESCVNTDLLEEKGLQPLQDLFKRLGGWPVVEGTNWDDKDFRWYNLVYKSREEGLLISGFYPISISKDLKARFAHPTKYVVCKFVSRILIRDHCTLEKLHLALVQLKEKSLSIRLRTQ